MQKAVQALRDIPAAEQNRSLGARALDWIKDNHAQQPSFGAQLAAMGREALKDVRATIQETYFGSPEHASEPGAPLNPTMQQTTAALEGKEVYLPQDRIAPERQVNLEMDR